MASRENYTSGEDYEFHFSGTNGILEKVYEPYEGDPLYECMMLEIDCLHFYYRTLIEDKWMRGMTLQQMRDKYNITLANLTKDLKVAYAIIREKCDCE